MAERGETKADSEEGVVEQVEQARDDAVLLLSYLSTRGVTVAFDPIVTVEPQKIARDPTLVGSLFSFLSFLARAAAPATAESIRIGTALGARVPASGEEPEPVARLRLFLKTLYFFFFGIAAIAVLFSCYVGVGATTITKAREIQVQLAALASEWARSTTIEGATVNVSCSTTKNEQLFILCAQIDDILRQRVENDRVLAFLGFSKRVPGAVAAVDDRDVARLAKIPPVVGSTQRWIDILGSLIPILYGAVGAAAFVLRSVQNDVSFLRVGTATIWQGVLIVILGMLAGATIGVYGSSSIRMGAIAFLVGYSAPLVLRLLDGTIELFTSSQSEVERDWSKLQLFQPISRTAHFAVGAILAILFLLVSMLLPGAPGLSLPRGFDAPEPSIGAIPFAVIIGGGFGAWMEVHRELIRPAIDGNEAAPRVPLPLLRYLMGGIAGYLGTFLLPSAVLTENSNISVFNPFVLALASIAVGYFFVRVTPLFMTQAERAVGSASAVEEGVRRAFTPRPFVNYNGYLCCVLRTPDLGLSISSEGLKINDSVNDYLLEIFFDPARQENALTTPILIDDGKDAEGATFDVEIAADGFIPRRRRLSLVAPRGRRSNSERLQYRRTSDKTLPGFRINVWQGDRVVQYATWKAPEADGPLLDADQTGS